MKTTKAKNVFDKFSFILNPQFIYLKMSYPVFTNVNLAEMRETGIVAGTISIGIIDLNKKEFFNVLEKIEQEVKKYENERTKFL
jgi:hypothetical protein